MSLVLDEHRRYLADRSRVTRYERALHEVVRPGDVVVDLASGTGILALLACRAGAARVYAVEAEPIADLARAIARENGFGDRLHVIRGHSSDVRIPELADVVVSDQIGRFGFEAGLLSLFADARAHFLKPGGRLVPSRLDLFIAPVEYRRGSARVAFWSRRPADFEFSPAHRIAANSGYPARFASSQLLSAPHRGVSVTLSEPVTYPLRFDASFEVQRAGTLDGVGGWFGAQLSPSVDVSNSPLDRERIMRRQAFLPVGTPVAVAAGDRIDVTMRILPDDVQVSWTVTVRPRTGEPVTLTHSTLNGMLIDAADVHRTHPAYRPALTERGVARQSVLDLCDGSRTLAEIESEIYAKHRPLFSSSADAAAFVGEVVTRYTRDAT
ncbi:MAG TPA: 50S ribosomal protein L11 methyltransferase [Vicinamibacterales bacterium]|nr:50S ribosomal protein L11 methyltransferase [Vicinamibacterales bacterium]